MASFLGFLTRDPSLISNTEKCIVQWQCLFFIVSFNLKLCQSGDFWLINIFVNIIVNSINVKFLFSGYIALLRQLTKVGEVTEEMFLSKKKFFFLKIDCSKVMYTVTSVL